MRPQRLDGIQWLRAAAATLVVIEHAKNAISTDYLRLTPDHSPLSFFPFAAGVDIFFVISGFIMAHASAPLFGRPASWRPFLQRRIARIVPLYWLVTSVMVVLFLATGSRMWRESGWGTIAASYLFLPAANPEGATFPMLVTGWTLNYEMAFYAIFALFIGFPRGVALSLTAATMFAIVALGLVAAPRSTALAFWSDPIILEFVAGIGLFALRQHAGLALPYATRALLAIAAIVTLALQAPYAGPWRVLAWGVPALMLVAAALPGPDKSEPSRTANLAGDLSYAIYLVHLPVVLVLQHSLRRLPAEAWVWFGLFPLLVAFGTLAGAWILHVAIERPILRAARHATKPG